MSRFWGNIGVSRGYIETSPGKFEIKIDEVEVTGELRQERFGWPQASMNDGLNARHVLSIVTPEDSVIDFTETVYIWWMSRQWSVTAIEYKRPRIELTFGGLYNG